MKIAEVYACVDCERDLTAAQLVHKKVPGSEGSCECGFCHQKRYCTMYRIQYGRGRRE